MQAWSATLESADEPGLLASLHTTAPEFAPIRDSETKKAARHTVVVAKEAVGPRVGAADHPVAQGDSPERGTAASAPEHDGMGIRIIVSLQEDRVDAPRVHHHIRILQLAGERPLPLPEALASSFSLSLFSARNDDALARDGVPRRNEDAPPPDHRGSRDGRDQHRRDGAGAPGRVDARAPPQRRDGHHRAGRRPCPRPHRRQPHGRARREARVGRQVVARHRPVGQEPARAAAERVAGVHRLEVGHLPAAAEERSRFRRLGGLAPGLPVPGRRERRERRGRQVARRGHGQAVEGGVEAVAAADEQRGRGAVPQGARVLEGIAQLPGVCAVQAGQVVLALAPQVVGAREGERDLAERLGAGEVLHQRGAAGVVGEPGGRERGDELLKLLLLLLEGRPGDGPRARPRGRMDA